MFTCAGCAAGIPDHEAEWVEVNGHKVLRPCKKCRDSLKKALAAYPKKNEYRAKKKEPTK